MDVKRTKATGAEVSYGLSALLAAMFLLSPLAPAGEGSAKGPREVKRQADKSVFGANKKEPIFITSDRMDMDQKKNTITYTGRVVAKQGELTLSSQVLTAYYDAEMNGIREVVAEGQVEVTQGDRVATGAKAVFSDKDQSITLTGNPIVRQGNSQVSGSRIVFFMEEERAVVDGGSQRVKATISPQDLRKRDEEKRASGKSR